MALSKVDLANQVENQLPQNLVANNLPFRNIIINGDMSIAQRGTSESGVTTTAYYTCDRWNFSIGTLGTWTISQDTDVPTGQGFATSLKLDCTTANASPSSNNSASVQQRIEGQMLQYLKKGTSNAESTTMSFWVKSNKTGTYTVELNDRDNSRTISKTYTIDSSNTWEKKTVTFAGDTTGAFDNDNARSLDINWWIGAGSNFTSGTLATSWQSNVTADRVSSSQVNLADNTANNFWITGVQLEAGTTASDFEFLPVDVNLARCQRYYQFIGAGANYSAIGGANDTPICNASSYNGASAYGVLDFTTTMRSAPSLDQVTGGNYYRYYNSNSSDYFDSFNLAGATSTKRALFNNVDAMTISAGQAGWFAILNDASYVALDSEL